MDRLAKTFNERDSNVIILSVHKIKGSHEMNAYLVCYLAAERFFGDIFVFGNYVISN